VFKAEIKTWSVTRIREFSFRIYADGVVSGDYAGGLDLHLSYGFSLTPTQISGLLGSINSDWAISDGVIVDRYTALCRETVDSDPLCFCTQASPEVEKMVAKVFPYIRREIDDYNAAFNGKPRTEKAVRTYVLDRIKLDVAAEFGLTSR